MVQLDKRAS